MSARARALTLVEVLVALAVLAIAGAALASMQLGALKASRTAHVGQQLAQVLTDEMIAQRLGASLPAGACATAAPAGWTCQVTRHCHAAFPACLLLSFEVRVAAPDGAELVGRGARFEPLLVAP